MDAPVLIKVQLTHIGHAMPRNRYFVRIMFDDYDICTTVTGDGESVHAWLCGEFALHDARIPVQYTYHRIAWRDILAEDRP